jgi:hypothetical protein
MCRVLPLDIIFPVRDAASAHFALMKAECLYAAGVIDADARAKLAERVSRALGTRSCRRSEAVMELDLAAAPSYLPCRILNADGRAK